METDLSNFMSYYFYAKFDGNHTCDYTNWRYEEMERPCFPGDSHLNPRNNFSWIMTDHLRDEDVLSITGEENVARSYFNQAQSRLAHLSQVHSKYEILIKKLSLWNIVLKETMQSKIIS